ncbi:MAG: SDR family oxidoreductase [Lachnospiraceae bacterium]|nr:SDR family oxidoreductase [Lachnospiraceae bacterium]
MNELFSLTGKRAVITGCATGIGQGLVMGLVSAGAEVVAVDIADLSDTREKVEVAGGKIACFKCDLASAENIDQVWNEIVSTVGSIDILFNNAGMQYRSSAFEYPTEVFDKIIDVNLRSALLLAQKAAKHYRERGCKGKIVNTASLFTTFGGVNVVGYTCTKHGILGLTRALSNEFSQYGICVNAIAPGYIQTELTKSIWSDPEKRKPIDERLPIGRWGTPEDFEGIAVFLASSASDYITGVMIPVDGGYTAR